MDERCCAMLPAAFGVLNRWQPPTIHNADRLVIHVRSSAALLGYVGWKSPRNDPSCDSEIGLLASTIDVAAPGPDGYFSYNLYGVNGQPLRAPAYIGKVPDLLLDLRGSVESSDQEAWIELWRGCDPK